MYDVVAFLIFTFVLIYFGLIGYLAWFSPKGYAKLVFLWKKWIKATSLIYSESYVNFFLNTSGVGLWLMRIIIIPAILFSIRGIILGIWGK